MGNKLLLPQNGIIFKFENILNCVITVVPRLLFKIFVLK